ncbi:MAG: hypothetical protein KJ892_06960 [Gammaproteobacteria bacterium]|nr:hypothetical protein [Gammaproteobacteria bacterium]
MNMRLIRQEQQNGTGNMRNHNKTRQLTNIIGSAFMLVQLFGNTASADYRGYWVDAVHQYQAENDFHNPLQSAAGQNYAYQEPASSFYREPVYQERVYPVEYQPVTGMVQSLDLATLAFYR